jgi:pentatricopeptide repeat protein
MYSAKSLHQIRRKLNVPKTPEQQPSQRRWESFSWKRKRGEELRPIWDKRLLPVGSPLSFSKIEVAVVNDKELLQQYRKPVKQLVKDASESRPLGNMELSDYMAARDFLDQFLKMKPSEWFHVNLVIDLLERLVAELAVAVNKDHAKWICDMRMVNPILDTWKKSSLSATAEQKEKLITAEDLIVKLEKMTTKFPGFRFDQMTIGIILEVILKQSDVRQAPKIAESILERAQTSGVDPNIILFNQLLQAYSVSGLEETPDKFDEIVTRIKKVGLMPDLVSYNVMLRYWGGKGSVAKIEDLLEKMESEGLLPTIANLSQAIFGMSTAGSPEKAAKLLNNLMKLEPANNRERNLVGGAVVNVLMGYKKRVEIGASGMEKVQMVGAAEDVFKRFENTIDPSDSMRNKLLGAMMDIYACLGIHDEVESMFKSLKPSIVTCNILIKSYAKDDVSNTCFHIFEWYAWQRFKQLFLFLLRWQINPPVC